MEREVLVEPNFEGKNEITFAGLMYFSDDLASKDGTNVNATSKEQLQRIYMQNAAGLAKSIRANAGHTFRLFTNDKQRATALLGGAPNDLCIEEISFVLDVPIELKFHSAHHKLEVIRHAAKAAAGYWVFLDLDVILIRGLPAVFYAMAKRLCPTYYDLTDVAYDQYGEQRMRSDFVALNGQVHEARWAGGEFLGGTPEFFSRLSTKIDESWDRYIKVADQLHHQGDEMIVSAALDLLRSEGVLLSDIGPYGIVGRYWSGRTVAIQRKMRWFLRNCAFLHLPQDKEWLAQAWITKRFTSNDDDFIKAYVPYASYRAFRGWIAGIIKSNRVRISRE